MTRLMCSKDPEEVGVVKSELFKAGIRSEVRQNPVAAALKMTRMELWVENESDFFKASKVFTAMQKRQGNGHDPVAPEEQETYIDVEEVSSRPNGKKAAKNSRVEVKANGEGPGSELEEVSILLEQEIEEILEREEALSKTCAELRSEVEALNQLLAESQSVAEKKTAEFTASKASLERELAEQSRLREELEAEARKLRLRVKSSDETLAEGQRKIESVSQQLQHQQSMVVELRKEIVSHEQRWEENQKALHKTRAELAAERESRIAAEEQAVKAARAKESLEKQLAEQKDLQQQLRASIGSLNSLRNRLQSKKATVLA